MDTDSRDPEEPAVAGDGSYLRRAQALIATRADLFKSAPVRLAGVAGRPQGRASGPRRRAGRQLALPLARESSGPRARMVR